MRACARVRSQHCAPVTHTSRGQTTRRQRVMEAAVKMAKTGLRVLALASGPSLNLPAAGESFADFAASRAAPVASALHFAGLVGIRDPPRPGVAQTVGQPQRGRRRLLLQRAVFAVI
jgi:magnesium-transporting ATPase (P-type)